MLTYYAIYGFKTDQPPRGIFVMDWNTEDGLAWNHMSKAWQYDPVGMTEFLFDERNYDRVQKIDRATAERITLDITRGREPLPSEETIYWIFQWKGEPPQSGDED
jgi:hypothetical protein